MGRMNPQSWHIRFAVEGPSWRLDLLPNNQGKDSLELVHEWGRLRPSKAQARAFRHELMALVKHYGNIPDQKGTDHLYKLVLAEETAG